METPEKEARKALSRLRRALEKSEREMDALEGSIRNVEGDDFPSSAYREARDRIRLVLDFLDEEAQRLEERILLAGGLEPGRIRRASSTE